jgi:hypothetical protein
MSDEPKPSAIEALKAWGVACREAGERLRTNLAKLGTAANDVKLSGYTHGGARGGAVTPYQRDPNEVPIKISPAEIWLSRDDYELLSGHSTGLPSVLQDDTIVHIIDEEPEL